MLKIISNEIALFQEIIFLKRIYLIIRFNQLKFKYNYIFKYVIIYMVNLTLICQENYLAVYKKIK